MWPVTLKWMVAHYVFRILCPPVCPIWFMNYFLLIFSPCQSISQDSELCQVIWEHIDRTELINSAVFGAKFFGYCQVGVEWSLLWSCCVSILVMLLFLIRNMVYEIFFSVFYIVIISNSVNILFLYWSTWYICYPWKRYIKFYRGWSNYNKAT